MGIRGGGFHTNGELLRPRKRPPSGMCPARRARIKPRESAQADYRLANGQSLRPRKRPPSGMCPARRTRIKPQPRSGRRGASGMCPAGADQGIRASGLPPGERTVVAAAKAAAFRDVPRPQGGDQAAESAQADYRLANGQSLRPRKRPPSGMCPARRAGIKPQSSAQADYRLANGQSLRPRKRPPSGMCPARRAGIKPRESAQADYCWRTRKGSAPPEAGIKRQESAQADSPWRARTSLRRRSRRLQGSAPPEAGIKRQESAQADSCFAQLKDYRAEIRSCGFPLRAAWRSASALSVRSQVKSAESVRPKWP